MCDMQNGVMWINCYRAAIYYQRVKEIGEGRLMFASNKSS